MQNFMTRVTLVDATAECPKAPLTDLAGESGRLPGYARALLEACPVRFLITALAGWVTQHQQAVLEYEVEENRVLRVQINRRRLRLTDEDRRLLAARGHRLGR